MTWAEFRTWAIRNGWDMPEFIGGSGTGHPALIVRVLGTGTPGSGNYRTYGRREQRRFAMWQAIRAALCGYDTRRTPEWQAAALDIAGDNPTGWVVYSAGRTWWTDNFDPLPHLTAGVFAGKIWRP